MSGRVTKVMIKQLPISIRAAHKSDVRSQFAALCYRIRGDKVQVLLITSRGSGRWILPKGWPVDAMTPAASAAREAWEEAGVRGKVFDRCLGLYSYSKSVGGAGLPIVAMIYPVRVETLADTYPEQGQRVRKWYSQKKAAKQVAQPELARIIKDFDPGLLQ
jgi:8-oxo-dGTP pyrophosphatase MutT (NUDIX family)